MTSRTLFALLLSLSVISTAACQRAPAVASGPTPIFIVVYPGDTIGVRARALAALVRDRLDRLTARAEVQVVPLRDMDAVYTFSNGPQPTTHQEFREMARLFRSDVVADVTEQKSGQPARAIVHYQSDAPPDSLRIGEVTTDSAMADQLARAILAMARIVRANAAVHRLPASATARTRVVMLGTGTRRTVPSWSGAISTSFAEARVPYPAIRRNPCTVVS